MKLIAVVISAMLATYSVAVAQGNPSGRGSTTGDPAARHPKPPRTAWRNGGRQFGQSGREWHVNFRGERRQWRSRPRQDVRQQHECATAGSAAREAELKVPRLMPIGKCLPGLSDDLAREKAETFFLRSN